MENLDNNSEAIKRYPWASDYIFYLDYRRLGLKDKSKRALMNFIKVFENRGDEEKRSFLNTVFSAANFTNDYSLYLPGNLYNEHFVPILNKWIEEAPVNFIPYRWSADFEHNKKAVILNPLDQISLLNFANRLINKVSMNQHEIANGFMYDGDVSKDIELIDFFEPFVGNINDSTKRDEIKEAIMNLKDTAFAYKAAH